MSSRLRQALEKYKSTGNNDFFFLRNDKDSAVVRFLYGANEDELDWYIVHETEIGGKKRWVQCPEEPACPLCASGNNPTLKLFIQLFDYTDNKVKTWERGQNFIGKLLSNMERYGALNSRKFEIERNGAAGSTQTTYELFAMDPDSPDLSKIPEKQELLSENGFVLQKSNEEMQAIVQGTFQPQAVESPTPRAGYQAPPQQNQMNTAPPQKPQTNTAPPAQNTQPQYTNDQAQLHGTEQQQPDPAVPSDNDVPPEDIF